MQLIATQSSSKKKARVAAPSFKPGQVSTPDGVSGDWKISTYTVEDAWMHNARAIRDGHPEMVVREGTYRRLTCAKRGLVMSNTPMEVNTCYEAFRDARGDVLILGLGLGMIIEWMLTKPEVTSITVVEQQEDVIKLVAPTFAKEPRVTILVGDADTFTPTGDMKYDYIWHDIWDDLSEANLPHMTTLRRRYRKYLKPDGTQGFWSQALVRKYRRQDQRRGYW